LGIFHNWNHKHLSILACLILTLGTFFSAHAQIERVSQSELNYQTRFLEAKKHRVLGDYQKAEDKLKKMLEDDGPNAVVHYELCLLYRELDNKEQALKSIKAAVEADNKNEWYLLLFAELAEEMLYYDDALDAFQTLYQNAPERHVYLKNIAYIHLLNGEPHKALQSLDKLEKLTLPSFDLTKQKHMIYERLGNMNKARQQLDLFLKYDPYNIEALRLMAAFLVKENKKNEAAKFYREILEIDPEDNTARLALRSIQKENSISNSSENVLEEIIKDENISLNNKIKQLIPLVEELSKRTNVQLASRLMSFADQLSELHGDDAKIFALKGDICSNVNQRKKAVQNYVSSIKMFDANYLVWEQLLYNLQAIKDYEKLNRYSEEAMDLFPNEASALIFYSVAQSHQGNTKEAFRALKQAKIIAAGNKLLMAEIFHAEATANLNKGNLKEAEQSFQESLKINPNNIHVLNNYTNLLLQNNELTKAEAVINDLLNKSDQNLDAQVNKAYLLQLQQKTDEALLQYDKALKLGADQSSIVLINYGDLLRRHGKVHEALSQYEKARQLDPENEDLQEKIKKIKSEIQ
jgi:tetratricopeptide (TPR) repeat protein